MEFEEEEEESCSPYKDEVVDFLDNNNENEEYNLVDENNTNNNNNNFNIGDDNYVTNEEDYLSYDEEFDEQNVLKNAKDVSLLSKISQGEDKAGLEQADKEKVNKVILQSTKGSRFFNKTQKDDERTKARVARMLQEWAQIRKEDLPELEKSADRLIAKLEVERDLSKSWIHVDMDAFYASVEIRDNPELGGIPMAVGSLSMLCTSNYEARKFGVRSAMPGFIAMKLCPNLTIVPMNMKKYKEASNYTRDIFARYDPNFEAYSLDEASLDISSYLSSHPHLSADDVAIQIRKSMLEETKLTCSIGIACNRRLAKICSNINKPDGQFTLASVREDIVSFMENLAIRKAPGIGKVTEKLLNALEITKCGEMYKKRGTLFRLFPGNSDYFFRMALGLGPVLHTEARASKSVSTERTFPHTSDPNILFPICLQLSHSLSAALKKKQLEGKTLTLKLKTANFETKTRCVTLSKYWSDEEEIHQQAKKLLTDEMPVDIRLMGVRMSGFKDQSYTTSKQTQIDGFFSVKSPNNNNDNNKNNNNNNNNNTSPKTINTVNNTSVSPTNNKSKKKKIEDFYTKAPLKQENINNNNNNNSEEKQHVDCPVCGKNLSFIAKDNFKVNNHIDNCLQQKESNNNKDSKRQIKKRKP